MSNQAHRARHNSFGWGPQNQRSALISDSVEISVALWSKWLERTVLTYFYVTIYRWAGCDWFVM